MTQKREKPNTSAMSWELPDGSLSVIDFDAIMTEGHSTTVLVTEHPVEAGSVIVDHVRPSPDTLALEVFISDTPLSLEGALVERSLYPKFGAEGVSVEDGRYTQEFQRVQSVYDQIRTLARTGQLVTVYTTLRTYKDLLITDVSTPRGPDDGSSVRISVNFRQIRFVASEAAKVPVAFQARDKKKRGGGSQATKRIDPKTEENSGSILDSVLQIGKRAV